jgi:hypothetical protein
MEAAALVRRHHGATRRVVLVTMLADDYAHLHDQMMCSLKRVGLSGHMVIVTDKGRTCDNLLSDWRAQCFQLDPGLLAAEANYRTDLEARYRPDTQPAPADTAAADSASVQLLANFLRTVDSAGAGSIPAAAATTAAVNTSSSHPRTSLTTPYDYGSSGFRRIAQLKPLLTRVGNLRDLDVLFVDGDIVFHSDPLHDLYSHTSDLVVQDDAVGAWTSSCKKKGDHNVNSGFYLLRAGDGSSRIIAKWLASIDSNPKLGAGDQIHLNAVLQASCHKDHVSKDAGFSWTVLSRSKYPNGRMFYNTPHYHGYRLRKEHRIVHFNWIRGIPEKLRKMNKEGLKFAGKNACREPEAVLRLDKSPHAEVQSEKSRGTRAEAKSVRASRLPCDTPPYVLDELHYAREGIGSSIWPHSTSIIFADAIGASWIDDPENQREASTSRADRKGTEQESSAMTPQAMPPEQAAPATIWNSHDKLDYAAFLGFRQNSNCDFASLSARITAGELLVIDAKTSMYGDHTHHSCSEMKHDSKSARLPKTMVQLCHSIAKGRGHAPLSADPMLDLAGGNRSKVVFRFRNDGDHRFSGAADCLYNPSFRSRYRAARVRRLLHWSRPGVTRPRDELWLSVHYRAGDVAHSKDYVAQGRGDLAGLAYYVQAVLKYVASEPERLKGRTSGLNPVVHLFSEGTPHAFKKFTDLLPDTVLHLGNDRQTAHDIDLMTQSHMLIGGFSSFFQMAAHLCDACVVLSKDVASDAKRLDEQLGKPWPRAYELVKLYHDSAADEHFDGERFGKALGRVLATHSPSPSPVPSPAPRPKKEKCGRHASRAECARTPPLPRPPASPPFFSIGGGASDEYLPNSFNKLVGISDDDTVPAPVVDEDGLEY